jgi:hypothetical protein
MMQTSAVYEKEVDDIKDEDLVEELFACEACS